MMGKLMNFNTALLRSVKIHKLTHYNEMLLRYVLSFKVAHLQLY